MSLGGVLALTGWTLEQAFDFAEALFDAADVDNRLSEVQASFDARRRGETGVYGKPTLRKCLRGTSEEQDWAMDALDMLIRASHLQRGSDAEIADFILSQQLRGAVFDEGLIWQQDERGIWVEVPESRLFAWAAKFDGVEFLTTNELGKEVAREISISFGKATGIVKFLVKKLADRTEPGFFAGRIPGIAFENGLWRNDSKGLIPLGQARARHCLPFSYPPEGPSDVLDGYTGTTWPEDQESVDHLGEILGYFLSGRTDLHKGFVFSGVPRAGKGVLTHVLEHLIGQKNVTATSIQGLAGEFGLQNLRGKTLAVCDDARVSGRLSDALANRIAVLTGEGSCYINVKGQPQVEARLGCRLLVTTNGTFGIADSSGADTQRWIFLRFDHTVPEDKRDAGLIDKLIEQGPAIVRLALEGLARLTARGHFIVPAACEREHAESLQRGNDFLVMRDEALEFGGEYFTVVSELNQFVKKWREMNDYPRLSAVDVQERFKGMGILRSKVGTRGSLRQRVYRGVRVRTEWANLVSAVVVAKKGLPN